MPKQNLINKIMIESKQEFNALIKRLKSKEKDNRLGKTLQIKLQAFKEVEGLINKLNIPFCTKFICHSCNEKKSGQNDDQLHEVCKDCFGCI